MARYAPQRRGSVAKRYSAQARDGECAASRGAAARPPTRIDNAGWNAPVKAVASLNRLIQLPRGASKASAAVMPRRCAPAMQRTRCRRPPRRVVLPPAAASAQRSKCRADAAARCRAATTSPQIFSLLPLYRRATITRDARRHAADARRLFSPPLAADAMICLFAFIFFSIFRAITLMPCPPTPLTRPLLPMFRQRSAPRKIARSAAVRGGKPRSDATAPLMDYFIFRCRHLFILFCHC